MREWHEVIDDFLTELAAAGQPATTRGLRRYHLRRLAEDMQRLGRDVDTVTRADLVAWLTQHEWARETMRSHRATVRKFYGWLYGSEQITRDPASTLPSIKPSPPIPRPVPEDAYEFALVIASKRERLMLRLAAEAGLRRGEVCKVHTRDMVQDLGDGELPGWSLIVHGKGDRVRIVPLKASLADEMRRSTSGYYFPGRVDGHLSPAYVGKRISALLPTEYSMHKLRTRFGTRGYQKSRDIFVVQYLLGHASPTTTMAYVVPPRDEARAAVEAI